MLRFHGDVCAGWLWRWQFIKSRANRFLFNLSAIESSSKRKQEEKEQQQQQDEEEEEEQKENDLESFSLGEL